MKQDKLLLMLLMAGLLAMMLPFSGPFAVAHVTDDDDDGEDDDGFDDDDDGDNGNGIDRTCLHNEEITDNVAGDVKIPHGVNCTLTDIVVGGNVQGEDGPGAVTVTGSTILGNVQIKGATEDVNISDNKMTITGNIQILEMGKEVVCDCDITVSGNRLPDGNIQVEKNRLASAIVISDNEILHGNIQLIENTATTIDVNENTVPGDLQLFKNDGDIGVGDVVANAVAGKLQCKENTGADFDAAAGQAPEQEDQCDV